MPNKPLTILDLQKGHSLKAQNALGAFGEFMPIFGTSRLIQSQGQTCTKACTKNTLWHERASFPIALYPPPGETITKIIRSEYFSVIFGGGYGKIT